MRFSSGKRRVVAGAALLAGAAVALVVVGRGIARRRPAINRVADDLRSPVLYAPFDLRNERLLQIVRSLSTRAATPIVAGVDVSDRTVGGSAEAPTTRVVLYEPPSRKRPSGALVWIHGGGMILGRPEMAHSWCSALAAELGILVVSVDYRLAPEHPFPAGLTDCFTSLTWLHEQAAGLGVDADRIAVGGDSAGGGLSAALCQLARDRGGPAICFQLLNYPMLDDRTVLRTDDQGRGLFLWTPVSNRFAWSSYLGHTPTTADAPPHAAPARTTDLAGLPPAWIGVGDLDLFYEEDVGYAARLEAAGVPCELHVEPGMYHGADQVVPKSPRMKAYRDDMVAALRQAIG